MDKKKEKDHVFSQECETNGCKICIKRRKAEIKKERDEARAKNKKECEELDWNEIDWY